jgi:hypothetical protein
MRHPEYEGRMLTVCAEREPSDKPDHLAYACTRRLHHFGDHVATTPNGIVARWPKAQS